MNSYKSIDEKLNTVFVRQEEETKIIPEIKPTVVAIVSVKKEYALTVAEAKENINKNFAEDYDYIRDTLKELMESGMASLVTAKQLAEETESPRAFEVASSIMTTVVNIGKELTNLHKDAIKMADSNVDTKEPITSTVVNQQNNYFSGTTKEFQSMLDDVEEVKYTDDE